MRSHIIYKIAIAALVLFIFTQPLLGDQHPQSNENLTADLYYQHQHDAAKPFLTLYDSNLCRTPSMVCELPQSGPIGSTCWCIGSSGPIKGVLTD